MEGRQKKLSHYISSCQKANQQDTGQLLSIGSSVRQLGLPRASEGMWGYLEGLGLQQGACSGQALCSAGPVIKTATFRVQWVSIRKHLIFTCLCLAVCWKGCTTPAPLECSVASNIMATSCTRGCLCWVLGKISSPKEQSAKAQLPRSGGITIMEVFQNHRDVALRDVGSGHGGVGWGWFDA